MGLTYAKSGVDIGKENTAISALIKQLTFKRKGFGAPITNVGHYAGLIDFGEYALALTTDGVGSKITIATIMGKWDTIGIDCIAMNVNDLLAMGIEPVSFVDYVAMEEPDEEIMGQIGIGLNIGAKMSNITIVGGETATLPKIIKGLDLAGTCLGIVKKDKIITGEKIQIGDKIIGIPSDGVHSNGYSLARRIIKESPYILYDKFPYNEDIKIGDELLKPTRIYMKILDVCRNFEIHGLAHITGGGWTKLQRITKYGFNIDNPLDVQPIFKFLQEEGKVELLEMYKTFNMGMGFVVVVPNNIHASNIAKILGGKIIGTITEEGIFVNDLKIC